MSVSSSSTHNEVRSSARCRRRKWRHLSEVEQEIELLCLPRKVVYTRDGLEILVNAADRPMFIRKVGTTCIEWADPLQHYDIVSDLILWERNRPPWQHEPTRRRVRWFLFDFLANGWRYRRCSPFPGQQWPGNGGQPVVCAPDDILCRIAQGEGR